MSAATVHPPQRQTESGPTLRPGIRAANADDLDALVALEQDAFTGDRLSRRQLRYLLVRARGQTLVAESEDKVIGYVTVLFSRAIANARVYSIAVNQRFRGLGTGGTLLDAAEDAALENGCVAMRLEVRTDNEPAIKLYRARGYRPIETVADYYDDNEPALRFEKPLGHELAPRPLRVPYYRQTLEFTCGPAALMMAMKTLAPELAMGRALEIELWRESTTVFMTSGIGGCTPFGLALAALKRGFAVELYTSAGQSFFANSVRSPVKKEVIRLVQEGFIRELKRLDTPIHRGSLAPAELMRRVDGGEIPVVLISSYRIYEEKAPHWVVVTGYDERFVYVHDPYVDSDEGETIVDSLNMPILHREFARMTRYGRAGLQAALFVSRPRARG